jgi:putative (di)nucleoside polyphosphate hydrolase
LSTGTSFSQSTKQAGSPKTTRSSGCLKSDRTATPGAERIVRTEYFRASVGAMLVNGAGKVLVLQRADAAKEAWQMPQGGLRTGENPERAIQRELREETGILPEHFKVIAVSTDWLAYELPEAYRNEKVGRGQVQKWFLCRFLGTPDVIRPDGIEFAAYEWVEMSRLLDLAAPFRRSVYERLVSDFAPYLDCDRPLIFGGGQR